MAVVKQDWTLSESSRSACIVAASDAVSFAPNASPRRNLRAKFAQEDIVRSTMKDPRQQYAIGVREVATELENYIDGHL